MSFKLNCLHFHKPTSELDAQIAAVLDKRKTQKQSLDDKE